MNGERFVISIFSTLDQSCNRPEFGRPVKSRPGLWPGRYRPDSYGGPGEYGKNAMHSHIFKTNYYIHTFGWLPATHWIERLFLKKCKFLSDIGKVGSKSWKFWRKMNVWWSFWGSFVASAGRCRPDRPPRVRPGLYRPRSAGCSSALDIIS